MIASSIASLSLSSQRCIWATRFGKNDYPQRLIVHEAIVIQQSTVSCASCATCLEVERGEGLSDETAAVSCLGGVVRNGHSHRLGCCQARRLRCVRHREYPNADRGRRCDTRRNVIKH